jgi:hypothetical protein
MVMLYTSLIRNVNPDRQHFNTTLSKSLLDQIKEIADEKDTSYNFILEEGMEWVMETYYLKGSFTLPSKPSDRVRINTTFSSRLFNKLKARCKRLGKGIYANDLIEEGMKYVIDEYNKK